MKELKHAQAAVMDEEELSEEQIELLLNQAESRLQNGALAEQQDDDIIAKYLPQRPQLKLERSMKPYIDTTGDVAQIDDERLLDDRNRKSANARRKIEDPVVAKKNAAKEKKATAGPNWYHLPRTNMTPQLKRDLQLLQMRSVLDPKKFFKKENTKAKPPEFSVVGTLVDGPTDFYSRTTNKERKQTLAEALLAGERENGRFRKKYMEIQAAKTSGKKADYKKRMTKRYGKKFKG